MNINYKWVLEKIITSLVLSIFVMFIVYIIIIGANWVFSGNLCLLEGRQLRFIIFIGGICFVSTFIGISE